MSGYGFSFGTSRYDDEDRLVNWERADSSLDQSWSLSEVGNWDVLTENSVTQNRIHGDAHELLTAAGQSLSHDAKGNMTSIPTVLRPGSNPLSLNWDFDNRLSSADVDDDGTDDVFYDYDALGRRVLRDDGTTETVYVPNGQQTIADDASGTAPTSPSYTYLWGEYIDELVLRDGTGGLRYYHRTQQYSITALTDSSGGIVERYAYDAYGNLSIFDGSGTVRTATAEGNRYTYTGREWDDELSLYHYRARMYDPVCGRFLSRDPIGYGDGMSLYRAYFGTSSVDPSGELKATVCLAAGICSSAIIGACTLACMQTEGKKACVDRCCAARGGCHGSQIRLLAKMRPKRSWQSSLQMARSKIMQRMYIQVFGKRSWIWHLCKYNPGMLCLEDLQVWTEECWAAREQSLGADHLAW